MFENVLRTTTKPRSILLRRTFDGFSDIEDCRVYSLAPRISTSVVSVSRGWCTVGRQTSSFDNTDTFAFEIYTFASIDSKNLFKKCLTLTVECIFDVNVQDPLSESSRMICSKSIGIEFRIESVARKQMFHTDNLLTFLHWKLKNDIDDSRNRWLEELQRNCRNCYNVLENDRR